MTVFISSNVKVQFVPLHSEIQYFNRKRGENAPKWKDNIKTP
jgi:hypothetical protein